MDLEYLSVLDVYIGIELWLKLIILKNNFMENFIIIAVLFSYTLFLYKEICFFIEKEDFNYEITFISERSTYQNLLILSIILSYIILK